VGMWEQTSFCQSSGSILDGVGLGFTEKMPPKIYIE